MPLKLPPAFSSQQLGQESTSTHRHGFGIHLGEDELAAFKICIHVEEGTGGKSRRALWRWLFWGYFSEGGQASLLALPSGDNSQNGDICVTPAFTLLFCTHIPHRGTVL